MLSPATCWDGEEAEAEVRVVCGVEPHFPSAEVAGAGLSADTPNVICS